MSKIPHDEKAKNENVESGNSKEISEKPKDPGRRDVITKGAVGAAALAAGSMLGAGSVFSQDSGTGASQKELAGKTAFITGGARGIGLACGEEMAKAGANIVLYDIASGQTANVGYPLATEGDLQSAKAKIEALGVKCLSFKGDVRSHAAQERAMAQAVREFGSLDIVVANAAVTQVGSIEEFSDDEISAVLDINVAGVVKTTQAAAPIMKKQKSGRIIYISSILGRIGNEHFPIYTTSKWAVIGFAKSAALAYAQDGIMCNTVSPGLVHTKFVDNEYALTKMVPHNPTFEALEEMLRPNNPIPMGSYDPIDIAKAVMFFTGNATAQVTGEVFDISSGSTARNIG